MPNHPDLKIVHDSEIRDPVPRPAEPRHNDLVQLLVQLLVGFAYSIPMWSILGWIVWMWWTGRM